MAQKVDSTEYCYVYFIHNLTRIEFVHPIFSIISSQSRFFEMSFSQKSIFY